MADSTRKYSLEVIGEPASDFSMGFNLINFAREMAINDGINIHIWKVIENWLGCTGRELNEQDKAKIDAAWDAYQASGIAPSIGLQKTFDEYKKEAEIQNKKLVDVPDIVPAAFDGILATEEEIALKNAHDKETSHKSILPLAFPRKIKHLQSWKGRLIYSLLFSVTFILFFMITEESTRRKITDDPTSFIAPFFIITTIALGVLTFVSMAIKYSLPFWNESKLFRQYCFGFGCWVVGTVAYVTLFGVEDFENWYEFGYYSNWEQLAAIALIPPMLFGACLYIYRKYIQ